MLQRNSKSIRTLLVVEYGNILSKARKAQKGLRTQYIFSIMLVGDNLGVRACDAGRLCGKSVYTIYNCFIRATKAGYIYKSNKRYYLTDSGKCVYNSICKEFDQSMNEILSVLMDEVRRKI